MLNKYPDSIGVQYLFEQFPCLKNNIDKSCEDLINKTKTKNFINSKILIKLIKNNPEYNLYSKIFSNNELILHIRVGDVLCKFNSNKFFHTKKTYPEIYSKYGDTLWWNDVLKYIKDNKINTIYLMYQSCTKECLNESINYINIIKKLLNEYKIIEIVKNTPDQDLMFCINTKHFITTGGGYGLIIGELIEKNGGNFIFKPERTVSNYDKNDIIFI